MLIQFVNVFLSVREINFGEKQPHLYCIEQYYYFYKTHFGNCFVSLHFVQTLIAGYMGVQILYNIPRTFGKYNGPKENKSELLKLLLGSQVQINWLNQHGKK